MTQGSRALIGGQVAARAAQFCRSLLRHRLVSAAFLQSLRLLSRNTVTIFMMHRFADPELGNPGEDAREIEEILSLLRKQGVDFVSLRSLVQRLATGDHFSRPTAVFTVDDCYRDFQTVVAPRFLAQDCPVTAFLSTDVVTTQSWYWTDRVAFAVAKSPLRSLELALGDNNASWVLQSTQERIRVAEQVVETLKFLDDDRRLDLVERIGSICEVDVPAHPPLEYSTLTWSDIRSLEASGVEFGPHTRTHPILSRVGDAKARSEIIGSWEDMKRECTDPCPVFCYPNGTRQSFGARDETLVREAGMTAAVSYIRSQVTSVEEGAALFRLPRIEWQSYKLGSALLVSGLRR